MKNRNHNILRCLFIISCLVSGSTSHSQTSFLEDTPSNVNFEQREIKGVVELPNGNFCTILIEDDVTQATSRVQSIFLFDQCGKYIEDIKFLNTDEYVEFYNITVFQNKILVLGYSNSGDFLLMLDPDNLSVINENVTQGYSLKKELVDNGLDSIWYVGAYSKNLSFATFDEELERKVNREVTLLDEDLRWVSFAHASDKHIFYSKTFFDYEYSEIGIADYNLNEIATIKGSSIHGPIRFGKLIFTNDSTFYTTVKYKLDEGLYYRKYIMDSMIFEIPLDISMSSSIGHGIQYEVVGDNVKVIYSNKVLRIYEMETAKLISEQPIFPDSLLQLNSLGLIKTSDEGLLSVKAHWTYIDNVWQSYIRLIKLNSELEFDPTAPSPCTVSTNEIARDNLTIKIGSNPNSGSFSLMSQEKLSSVRLFTSEGNRLDATIESNAGYNYQINTEVKGLVIIVAKTDKGAQVTKKVIIY